jgi:hypothetical protein
MSSDDVRTALQNGSTLADLAKKQGKSVDDVVAAIVASVKANIAQAVKDGKLTQDQADRITSSLEQRVRAIVQNGHPFPRFGGPDGKWHGRPGFGAPPGAPPSAQPSAPSSPSSNTGYTA